MASKILGRVPCPVGCGHNAAAVKLKTDKEAGKAAYPYVHCAGCGVQMHTRSEDQARHLLAMTRAEKGAEAPPKAESAPPGADPAPVDNPAPQAPKKATAGLFGLFAEVAK